SGRWVTKNCAGRPCLGSPPGTSPREPGPTKIGMSEKVYGPAALKRAQVLVLSSRDEFVRCGRRAAGALIRLDGINVRNRFPPRTTVVLRACMWPHAAKPISQMRHPPGFEDGTREAHSSPRLRAGRRPVVRPDRAGGLPRREESLPRPRAAEPRPRRDPGGRRG